MKGGLYLSDREWTVLEPLLPKVKRRKDGRGRPPKDPREVLNGIIWILFSGAPWHMLPDGYPPYQTCHRYFQGWTRKGVMQRMLGTLSAYHASKRKQREISFIDASFSPAKKGAML
jgi:transposase